MRELILALLKKAARTLRGTGIGRFPLVTRTYNFLLKVLVSDNLFEVQGHKMYIEPYSVNVASGSMIADDYERFETELFKKQVKKGMTVLDIGAHIGYYTLLAANLVGENGRVFAFEPHPHNFAMLEKNVGINGYKNVVLVQKAVSNQSGHIKLFLSEYGTLHSLSNQVGKKSIVVEAVTLDEFLGKDCQVDVVKVDIEGAEMLALLGADRLIRTNGNLKIFTEFVPERLKISGFLPEEYLNKLMDYGFKVWNINDQTRQLEPVDDANFKSTCESESGTNLYCVKGFTEGTS
jgi:FkbM family methyltransferase